MSDLYLEEARRRGLIPPADNDAYIAEAVKRGLMQPMPAPEEPPTVPGAGVETGYVEPTLAESAMRALKLGVQDVGAGAADLIGAPVDLMTGALNAGSWLAERAVNAIPGVDGVQTPRIENPIGGSADAKATAANVARAAGFNPISDAERSSGERMSGAAIEAATNALMTGGALRGPAMSRVAQVDRKPAAFDSMLAPYEKGGVRPHIGDAAAGAGSGVAVDAGREYLPEEAQGPLTDFVLSTLGGLGGNTLANVTTAPVKSLDAVTSLLPDKNVPMMEVRPGTTYDESFRVPVSRGAVERAARYTQENASNPAKAGRDVAERSQYFKDNNLPTPTTGTLSGDVGLGAIEQGDRVRNPVPYQEADQRIRSAASDNLRSVAPENANPRAATEFSDRDVKAQSAAAKEGVAAAEKKNLAAVAAESAVSAPYREPIGAGPASRALDEVVVEQTMKPRQKEKNAKFAAIPDAERDVAPMLSAAQRVRDTLGSLNNPGDIIPEATLKRIEALAPKKETTPGEPATFKVDERGISEKVSGGPVETTTGGKVSFQDLNKLRPELSDAIRAARRAGNYTLADNLKALKREINGEAERMAAEGSTEASEALRYFKDDFAPYFGEGTVGGKLRNAINKDTDRVGTPPSATADRFLNVASGAKEAAADLRKILEIAPDPDAGNKAVRQYVLSDLAKTVDANGTIDPRRLKDWVGKRADMLSEFPAVDTEVRKLLNDVVNSRAKTNATAAELKKAVADAKLTEADIQNGSLSLLLDSSPEVAVTRVFGSKDPEKAMREITQRLAKDPTAAAGWKKTVSNYMENKLTGTNTQMTDSGDPAVSFAATKKFLRDNKAVLSSVYSPAEMNALQKAEKLLEPFGALSRRATVGSPTAENNTQAWRTMEAALKAYYGVLKGGGVLRTLKLAAGTLPNSDAQVGWLVHKMQFDPELAVHLLNKPLKDVDTPTWNAKLNKMLAVEQAARASSEGEAP